MTNYQIRIMRKGDNNEFLFSTRLMGDHAAVRRAQLLVGEGDVVEVWRGMTCIYSTHRENVH